jgi:hypothetical protein
MWFYLTFAVSSTMMPSASDRRAWMPIFVTVFVVLAITLLAGAGPWVVEYLGYPINQGLRAIAIVIGIGVLIHLVLLPPLWLLRHTLSRMTGLRVV